MAKRGSAKPDAAALQRLRELVGELQTQRGRSLSRAELVKLASTVEPELGVTVDLDAIEDLGQALVVLRPADDGEDARFETLSAREREVASLLARGLRNKEIAEVLHISVATVKDHVHRVLEKSGLRSRAEVAAAWRAES